LLKLFTKTGNSYLFADIVGKNIPMSSTNTNISLQAVRFPMFLVRIVAVGLAAVIVYRIIAQQNHIPKPPGSSGGAQRKSTKRVIDESSSTYNEKDCPNPVRSVSEHLVARFKRYIRLGGIIQRISEQTNIPRNEVVRGGPSQYQDQRSHRGRDIHAAHVVRVGEIDGRLRRSEQLYTELVNFVGHTQNVRWEVNVGRVGADIDTFQSGNLETLASIDFSEILTQDSESTIEMLRQTFITILNEHIENEKLPEEVIEGMMKAKEVLTGMTVEELLKKGKNGYEGKGMKRYQ
jgi:hypothetical protein